MLTYDTLRLLTASIDLGFTAKKKSSAGFFFQINDYVAQWAHLVVWALDAALTGGIRPEDKVR